MYALNIAEDGRVLSATLDEYAPQAQPRVETLPDGAVSDYRFEDGSFILDPLPEPDEGDGISIDERLAQIEAAIAMLEEQFGESDDV